MSKGRVRRLERKNMFLQHRQTNSLRHSQPIDSVWLMYLCVCSCVCVLLCKWKQWDNSAWAGGAHAVREHRSAFTGTDPQGQGQTDGQMEKRSIISSFVQRFPTCVAPSEHRIDPHHRLLHFYRLWFWKSKNKPKNMLSEKTALGNHFNKYLWWNFLNIEQFSTLLVFLWGFQTRLVNRAAWEQIQTLTRQDVGMHRQSPLDANSRDKILKRGTMTSTKWKKRADRWRRRRMVRWILADYTDRQWRGLKKHQVFSLCNLVVQANNTETQILEWEKFQKGWYVQMWIYSYDYNLQSEF